MSRLPSIDPRKLRDHADDARVERIWSRLREDMPVVPSAAISAAMRAQPKPTVGRTAMLFAAALGMLGVGLVIGRMGVEETKPMPAQATSDAEMTDVFAAGSRPRTFALPGGGRIVVEPGSMVEVVSISDALVHLSLLHGAASLDAVQIPIDVVAGEAIVTAPAGASVSLARRESNLDVLVAQGSAYVKSPAGQQIVNGGHVLAGVPTVTTVSANDQPERIVPPVPQPIEDRDARQVAAIPTANGSAAPTTTTDPVPAPVATVAVEPAAPSWLALAQNDKHQDALTLLEKGAGLEATIKGAQSARELMYLWELAASGKKGNLQVFALKRVADEFGSDPSAYVAAMQLAQLYEATDKQLAAKYREKAAQTKSFAEIALCAQIRAMGDEVDTVDPRRAAQKANEYLKAYPLHSCAGDAKELLEEVSSRLGEEDHEPKKSAPPAGSAPSGSAPPAGPAPSASAPSAPSGSAPPAAPSAAPSATPSARPSAAPSASAKP